MAEYYAVDRSDEYLAHYGVFGMKWGIRKAKPEGNGGSFPKSAAYANAEKKLKRATLAGGLIGGAISAARNRDALRSAPSAKKVSAKTNAARAARTSSASLSKYSRDVNKGTIAAGLLGGGAAGGLKAASNIHKMKKNNPREYAKFQKAYKNASLKERIRFAYGR